MSWSEVGNWIKDNAGVGTALIGSLLTGNVPSAVAAGVALVSSATGSSSPQDALQALQNDPATVVKLKELYYKEEDSIRQHIREIYTAELEDKQKQHQTTQETIRAGDVAEDRLVRWTRPLQSWLSLALTFVYIFVSESPSIELVIAGLTLPWAYAGLREFGKGVSVIASAKTGKVK